VKYEDDGEVHWEDVNDLVAAPVRSIQPRPHGAAQVAAALACAGAIFMRQRACACVRCAPVQCARVRACACSTSEPPNKKK